MPIEAPTAASVKRSSPFSTGDRSGEKWETSITTTSEMVAIFPLSGMASNMQTTSCRKIAASSPQTLKRKISR